MKNRELKDLLYGHVARMGHAVSSPKRLELLELLAQEEKSVETLAKELSVTIKLASAHLKVLKAARLVTCRRDGKYMLYRLSSDAVAGLWVNLRSVAEEHLIELQLALEGMMSDPDHLAPLSRAELFEQARNGDVVVIDVRPESEYMTAHLPYARSMPLGELSRRMAELPEDGKIVAYCRGPFCLLSDEAVKILQGHGRHALKWMDGISEWRSAGYPLEKGVHQTGSDEPE